VEMNDSFSALQRAENSSIVDRSPVLARAAEFQCSSASRKFLNTGHERAGETMQMFQCSSASRKFLNSQRDCAAQRRPRCFSALQRAENSSI